VNPPAPVMEEGAEPKANGSGGNSSASNPSGRPSHSAGGSDSRARSPASRPGGGANANGSRERALSLWRAKALKRMKEGKPARCSFETEALPVALSAQIERALELAETRDEVRRVFDELPLPQSQAPQGHVAPIYVVTHGATRYTGGVNADDRITGWLDPPLTPEGRIEARNFGRGLKNLGIQRIYSSDLLRASQTAAQIKAVIEAGAIKTTRELRPWNLGEYQGRLTANVMTDLLSYVREGEKKVPGGESFDTWKLRLLTFIAGVMEEQEAGGRGAVLLLTHSRCLELIRAWLVGAAAGDLSEDVHFAMDAVPRGGTLQIVLGPAGWVSSAWEPALTSATVSAPHDPRRESIFDEVRVRWREREREGD
jgi:broad specificity phosphatase PhoE